MFNAEQTTNKIIEWIKNWFLENGPTAKAVIGISGGKDSSITAALLVKALGKERVYGVLMPNGTQTDIEDSYKIIKELDIDYCIINIESSYNALLNEIGKNVEITNDIKINMPPRLRMTTLYAIAQSFKEGGRVANTCNLSEDYIGYSTKYGDSAGDFAPLADLTVNQVLQIGDYLGINKTLVHKTPSDGLSGLSDEEKIGFTYEVLDKYIETGICEDEKVKEKIDRMYKNNLHKLEVIPKFKLYEENA